MLKIFEEKDPYQGKKAAPRITMSAKVEVLSFVGNKNEMDELPDFVMQNRMQALLKRTNFFNELSSLNIKGRWYSFLIEQLFNNLNSYTYNRGCNDEFAITVDDRGVGTLIIYDIWREESDAVIMGYATCELDEDGHPSVIVHCGECTNIAQCPLLIRITTKPAQDGYEFKEVVVALQKDNGDSGSFPNICACYMWDHTAQRLNRCDLPPLRNGFAGCFSCRDEE